MQINLVGDLQEKYYISCVILSEVRYNIHKNILLDPITTWALIGNPVLQPFELQECISSLFKFPYKVNFHVSYLRA